jgi:hypothetical protein
VSPEVRGLDGSVLEGRKENGVEIALKPEVRGVLAKVRAVPHDLVRL